MLGSITFALPEDEAGTLVKFATPPPKKVVMN